MTTPEWAAPAHLTDPIVRRITMQKINTKKGTHKHVWSGRIRGQLPQLAHYAVARALAHYGNADGTRCHPGLTRLANDLAASTKSVQRALDYLTEAGWISLNNPGIRRRGEANEYSLSIPAPHAVEAGWWPENEQQWTERPTGMPRHTAGRRCPPKPPLGGHSESLGGQKRARRVDAGVQPPGSTHQFKEHHSERFSLGPTLARAGDDESGHEHSGPTIAAILDGIDLDDELYLDDDLMEALSRHGIEVTDERRFTAMVSEGRIEAAIAIELAEHRSAAA